MKIRKVLQSELLNFGCAGYSSSQAAQFVGHNNFSQITLWMLRNSVVLQSLVE